MVSDKRPSILEIDGESTNAVPGANLGHTDVPDTYLTLNKETKNTKNKKSIELKRALTNIAKKNKTASNVLVFLF